MQQISASVDTLCLSLGAKLIELREQRGWSLSKLANLSTIGKATLSGIEAGKGNPTIETIWRLANALDVPFGLLVDENLSTPHALNNEALYVQLLHRQNGPQRVETYLMELGSKQAREAEAHIEGCQETIVVLQGQVRVGPEKSQRDLSLGQSHEFSADVPHRYQSLSDSATVLVNIIYPATVNAAKE